MGNNNAYCQDNEISWFHWDLNPSQKDLLEFTRYMIRLFKEQPTLGRRKFLQGRSIRGMDVKDISWFEPNGKEMDDSDWEAHFARCLGVRLSGEEMAEVDEAGNPLAGDTLFLLFNAHHEPIRFILPAPRPGERWEKLLDTADLRWSRRSMRKSLIYKLQGRSITVFRLKKPEAKP